MTLWADTCVTTPHPPPLYHPGLTTAEGGGMGSWVTPACLANPWWLVWPAQPDPPWIPGAGWPAPQAEGGPLRTRPFGCPTLPPACQLKYCSPGDRLRPLGRKPSAHSLHSKGSKGKLGAPPRLGRVPWGHGAPPAPRPGLHPGKMGVLGWPPG